MKPLEKVFFIALAISIVGFIYISFPSSASENTITSSNESTKEAILLEPEIDWKKRYFELFDLYKDLKGKHLELWEELRDQEKNINIYLNHAVIEDCNVLRTRNYDRVENYLKVTDSMYPCIDNSKHDKIYLKNIPFDELKTGDVVMYKKDVNKPCTNGKEEEINCIVHRIVIELKNPKAYITKGDSNNYFDEILVEKNNYLGLVVWVE